MKTISFFEANGQQIPVKNIESAVKKDMKKKGIKGEELALYFNADEMRVYYAVDQFGGPDQYIDF